MKERGQADYLVLVRVLLELASISFSTRDSIATNESSGKGVEILPCTTSTVHYANCCTCTSTLQKSVQVQVQVS